MDTNTQRPTEIKLRQKSRLMELVFSDGSQFELSYELLRVYSPSAEVRGHGPGQEVLQVGKCDVDISTLEQAAATQCSRRSPTGTALASIPGTTCTGWARTAMRCGGNTSSASKRPGRAASRA